jgi:hypothetical protein
MFAIVLRRSKPLARTCRSFRKARRRLVVRPSSLACCIRCDGFAHHLEPPFHGVDPAAELRHVTPPRRRLAGRLVRGVKVLQALELLLFPLHPLVVSYQVLVIAPVHGLASITEAVSVKSILVHRAHRLLSESTRILCTSPSRVSREYEDRPDCLKHALLRGQETVSLSQNTSGSTQMNGLVIIRRNANYTE